jgi:hypothetical protein
LSFELIPVRVNPDPLVYPGLALGTCPP